MRYHDVPDIGERGTQQPPDSPPLPIRPTFLRLQLVGLSAAEAGNLTAHLTGLRAARRPWTVAEIERILFLRALVDSGRLSS